MLAVFGYGAQVWLCWHTVVGRAVSSLHALVLALQGCCQLPAVLLLRSVRAHLLGTERMHAHASIACVCAVLQAVLQAANMTYVKASCAHSKHTLCDSCLTNKRVLCPAGCADRQGSLPEPG
jgi:hypothetical protein